MARPLVALTLEGKGRGAKAIELELLRQGAYLSPSIEAALRVPQGRA